MKKILPLTLLLMVGCSSAPKVVPLEKTVVKQTEYVIRIPPAELMALPEAVPGIDVDAADQAAVADWLLLKEKYTREVENQLKGIARFFVQTQDELNAQAEEENAAALAEREAADRAAEEEAITRDVFRFDAPIH